MAKKTMIGAGIALDGEKEFRSAITGIRSDMNVLNSEMKLSKQAFSENANSIEALTNKDEILNKQLDKQKDKVDALRKALANSVTQYGENDTRTDKWKTSLNYAEIELSKLDSELKINDKYMDEAKTSTNGMATSIDNFGKEVKIAGDKTLETGDIIKANLASAAVVKGVEALGSAVKDLGGSTVGFAIDSTKAFNTLATKTGATDEELGGLKDTMNAIYDNNFGESIGDVANAMATVKQQTGLANEELQKTTEQAILMKDTFDFEVNESIRSAQMMMTQFGLTSEESFNLIAQGAQNGLDKNGDLLDSINEYSVHFEQLGLDSTEMFNMMLNGSKSGTFSVDQLGDAIKEFGIRVKDGSTTSNDAFASIGLDAKQMARDFIAGGDTAQSALDTTVASLFKMKDPLAQNTAGVGLFGTMWENLGVDGVKALMNVNGEISTTTDALSRINAQKYDDIGSALMGVGRQIQTSISEPLGETLEPIVDNLIGKIQDNAPEIQASIEGISEALGDGIGWFIDNSDLAIAGLTGIGAAMVTNAAAGAINEVVVGYKAFKVATEGATVAQWAMNTAQAANPIGLVATGLVALGTAMVVYGAIQKDTTSDFAKLSEKIKNAREENKKLAQEISDSEEAFKDNTDEVKGNYSAIQILSDKLYDLADNEKKTNVEKEQMQILVNQLNDSLPELNLIYDATNDLLSEQKTTVDGLVQSMKEKAIAQVYEERYLAVAEEQVKLEDALKKAIESKADAEDNYKAAVIETEEIQKNATRFDPNLEEYKQAYESAEKYKTEIKNAGVEVENANKTLDEHASKFDALDEAIGKTTESTEEQATATVDTSAKIETALAETELAYEKAKSTAVASIQGQIDIFDKFDNKTKVSKETLLKNLKSQVTGMEDWATNLDKLSNSGIDEGLLQHLKKMGPSASAEIKVLSSMSEKELKEYSKQWKKLGTATEKGASETVETLKTNWDEAYASMGQSSTVAGKDNIDGYISGAKSKQAELNKASKEIIMGASSAANTQVDASAQSVGKNFAEGIEKGMNDGTIKVKKSASIMANEMVKASQKELIIESPSKRMRKEVGQMAGEGVALGLEDKIERVKKSASELASEAFSSSTKWLDNYKVYQDMSIEDEVDYWNRVRKQFKAGTQERIDADQKYFDAKENLANKEKDLADKKTEVEKTYAENSKKINDELLKDIEAVTKAYDDAVDSRAKSIVDSMGLFDEFKKNQEVTGTELLNNLQGQVTGLSDWTKSLDDLAGRGIDKALLEELQDMGVKSAGEVEALNSMTDGQLTQYVALWKDKNKLAKDQAIEELAGMKTESSKKIDELIAQAEIDLRGYTQVYTDAMESLVPRAVEIGAQISQGLAIGMASNQRGLSGAIGNALNGISMGGLGSLASTSMQGMTNYSNSSSNVINLQFTAQEITEDNMTMVVNRVNREIGRAL